MTSFIQHLINNRVNPKCLLKEETCKSIIPTDKAIPLATLLQWSVDTAQISMSVRLFDLWTKSLEDINFNHLYRLPEKQIVSTFKIKHDVTFLESVFKWMGMTIISAMMLHQRHSTFWSLSIESAASNKESRSLNNQHSSHNRFINII